MSALGLKRALVRGKPRIERDGDVWIARTADGQEILEPGFRWNTRSGAWCACWESDNIPPKGTAHD